MIVIIYFIYKKASLPIIKIKELYSMKYKLLITIIILLNITSCSQKDETVNLIEKKEKKIVQQNRQKKPILQKSVSDEYLERIKREMEKDNIETTKIEATKIKITNKPLIPITKKETPIKISPIVSYQKPEIQTSKVTQKTTQINSDTPAHIRNSSIESVPRF